MVEAERADRSQFVDVIDENASHTESGESVEWSSGRPVVIFNFSIKAQVGRLMVATCSSGYFDSGSHRLTRLRLRVGRGAPMMNGPGPRNRETPKRVTVSCSPSNSVRRDPVPRLGRGSRAGSIFRTNG